MYKCQKCGRLTKPGEKQNKLVVQTREKTYINKVIENKREIEKVTTGFEIAKEINVCDKCYEESIQEVE